ncbi:MAG: hypothetical protein IPL10_07390 [Bacteroidetes bacterium]|nr:hypothetical protein [Bacteroidota bacterium]
MKFIPTTFTILFCFFSTIICAQTSPTIAELEQQKAKAAQEENFKLASELKLKIQELKDKEQAAEEERKKAEVEEFKKEIEESVKRKKEEEAAKKTAEQIQKEEAQSKLANEAKQKAEQQALLKEKQEAEQKRKSEELALLKERQAAEQKQKAEQQALLKEKQAAEQKQKAEELALLKEKQAAEQRQKAEEQALLKEKLAAEQKQKAEELALLKEQQAAEQKQKAEEQALLKAKLDQDLKQRAEEQLLEKEIALAEQNVKKETDIVKAIEAQITKAVASENYLLAEELKGKIKSAKENGEIRLANVATDIKRKKEEKKAQEALEKENAEKQRLQLAAELERKKENARLIENLEKEKAKAVADANFILAEELKVKINALKENKEGAASAKLVVNNTTESELEKLEKAKAKAVAESDFKLAEELKVKINALKNNSSSSNTAASTKSSETKSNNPEIAALEKQKAKAVADGDFKLAGELKNKIATLKADADKNAALNAQISELEKQKTKAVADTDYKLAGEISAKIKTLKDPNYNKPASNSVAKTTTNTRTSSANLSQTKQSTSQSTTVSKIENASTRISRSSENDATGIKYRRSSLYTVMINNTSRERAEVIKDAFEKSPLPEKFNDHNLTVASIDVTYNSNANDLVNNLNSYFLTKKIAKELVAKWFNRNEKGCFNMDLIKERGEYNASNIDLNLAKSSARGLALLADAGEELISNTYVVINDFRFTNKEEVANKAKAGLGLLNVVSTLAGGPDLSAATTIASAGATIAGKGYTVRTNSYLFQLVWNAEVAATFYQNYWMDENSYNESKKQAFDESDLFTLKYIGTETGLADLQSTIFTNKTEDELIYKATSKAVDNGIAKLQRKFEEFRVKVPLYSTNPLSAKIGKKEGLEAGDRFEVLEQVQDAEGKLSYVRKGVITVDGKNIWDNTNTIEELEEAGKNTNINQYTIFNGSGDYAPGMLIRQIR